MGAIVLKNNNSPTIMNTKTKRYFSNKSHHSYKMHPQMRGYMLEMQKERAFFQNMAIGLYTDANFN